MNITRWKMLLALQQNYFRILKKLFKQKKIDLIVANILLHVVIMTCVLNLKLMKLH